MNKSRPSPSECAERIWRLLSENERFRLIEPMLMLLGEQSGFDRTTDNATMPESHHETEVDKSDALDEWLRSHSPQFWPGETLVNMDNLGDPGFWLDEQLGERPYTVLFEHDSASIAKILAPAYLAAIRERGFPLPSDFGDEPSYDGWTEEEEANARSDFIAMINHWRETVISSLERQRKGTSN